MFKQIKKNLELKVLLVFLVIVFIPFILISSSFYFKMDNIISSINLQQIDKSLLLTLTQLKIRMIIFFVFGLVLISLIWLFINKRVIQPLKQMLVYLKKFVQEGSFEGIKIKKQNEIGQLIVLVNKILLNLKESKNIIRLLKEMTNRFEGIVENSDLWIWEVNEKLDFIYSGNLVLKILACTKDEIIGKKLTDFFNPEDQEKIKITINNSIKKNEIINIPISIKAVKKNGQIIYLELTGMPIYFSNKKLAFRGLIKDVTESKRQVEKMRRFEQKFHQKEKLGSLKQFGVGVAHNFNNKLTGIKGFADILKKALNPEDTLSKHVDEIISISEEAANINRQLLEFTSEGDKKYIPVDMHKLIDGVFALLLKKIGEKIIVMKQFNSSFFITTGDPMQLQQVLINVILNSVEAISDKGKINIITDLVKLDENFKIEEGYNFIPGRYLQIDIEDDGIGMNDEIQQCIFDPFFTTKGDTNNVGMGMSFVHGTILEHNGMISVSSEKNKGTIVKLFFPIVLAEVKKINSYDMGNVKFGQGRTIAVIDDDGVILNSLQQNLQILDYNVFAFAEGRDFVRYYNNNANVVDVVLLDMVLQDIDGQEILEQIKKINPNVKVLLMSGYTLENITDKLIEKGNVEFIKKPFTIPDISIRLHDLISD